MPRTVEHIVACHQAATELRNAGKPIWNRRVTIKHLLTDDQSSDEKAAAVANKVAAALRSGLPKRWLDSESDDLDLDLSDIVESLASLTPTSYADSDDGYTVEEDVNNLLDSLYDWADANRVWVA